MIHSTKLLCNNMNPYYFINNLVTTPLIRVSLLRNGNYISNRRDDSKRSFGHCLGNVCLDEKKNDLSKKKPMRTEKEVFSLFSYVKQQETNRNDEENRKQQIIFEQQVKALKEHIETSTAESVDKDNNNDVDWNEMTANEFQRYTLELFKKCIHSINEKNHDLKLTLKAEPSEPLTDDEKNFIRDKFRYLIDTTAVQFFDKITKTNIVRPDFLVMAHDRKFIFDAKHYNSKSVRNKDSPLIGKQLIFTANPSRNSTSKGEVNIYEIVKLYRDIHAFKATGGGLILSPNTKLTPSAQHLAVTLNLIIIKLKKKGKLKTSFQKIFKHTLIFIILLLNILQSPPLLICTFCCK
ncbi:hypothetical protein C9374_001634 [Naegleria lovaniensis]|uniref:Uncharacterized protein n=1 Tax=Naegleria lovaniensis TaxID=51637 RepID=A0AA88GUK7_NAELO|nr:uncharacterized protein C9374_001634 [Naegleria lovaniensis]KAG2387302.1 hypothetical protein C9374_001634 [Naegleria lovaniensis]